MNRVKWFSEVSLRHKAFGLLDPRIRGEDDQRRIIFFTYWMSVKNLSSPAVAAVDGDVVDVASNRLGQFLGIDVASAAIGIGNSGLVAEDGFADEMEESLVGIND